MTKVEVSPEEVCKELLIVGNGMDLCCNLKSSYDNFYEQRYTQKIKLYMESRVLSWPEPDMVQDYGLMDLILLATFKNFEGEIKWNDIESTIADMLNPKFDYSLDNLFKQFKKVFVNYNEDTGNIERGLMKNRILNVLVSKSVIAKDDDDEIIKTKLKNELVDSINRVEQGFKKYLNENVKESDFYNENVNRLYTHIIGLNFKSSYVINFNYTSEDIDRFYEFNNVHGSLKDENRIIFGIDENLEDEKDNTDKKNNQEFFIIDDYKLTKTYKKISLDTLRASNIKPLPKEIKTIKFFGHSLNKADYSYFQSIFDHYNIYNSDVVLTFYYTNYSDEALSNQIDGMITLLKKYGSTMGNKDHGKNLLHKLSLEGRMKIEEIKVKNIGENRLSIEV